MSDSALSDLTVEVEAPAPLTIVMTALLEVQEEQRALSAALARHIADDERRMRLVDQFIDPAMSLQEAIAQTISNLKELREMVQALARGVRKEHHETRTAIALHMGDPAALEREQRRRGRDS